MSGQRSNDPLAPTSDAAGAFAGPIVCVTIISREPDQTDRFYGDVLEMARYPEASPARSREQQKRLWSLPEDFDWQEAVYWRPTLPEVPMLRVLNSDDAASPVRPEMNARLEGGLSVGFAMHDLDSVVARGAELGFGTTAGVGALDMQRADGSTYQAHECHFRAPDDVYALGVSRPPDLAPVGPIEEGKRVGGPSYTGQVMNHRRETLRFYTEVLGYEIRRDMQVGGAIAEKGLGLSPGTTMQFLQVFAPGSTSGYFVVLDFGDSGIANPAVSAPASGIVMWTIPVSDADRVADGAAAVGCSVIAGPEEASTPYLGAHRAVTVRTVNGFVVECIERI